MAAKRLTVLDSRDAAHAWLLLRGARRLVADSRHVAAGDGFIAWPGYATDARRHVGEALAAGAMASLVEVEGVEAFDFSREPRVAAMRGLKAAAGEIASRFCGTPSERLDVVAVTGTNGKTSTAWWIAQALGHVGRRTAVVGTLGFGEPPRIGAGREATPPLTNTGLTTPDPITLQAALADFADRGFSACAIEASSIGIVEHRLAGTRVRIAVFTNFTQDHLDYHGDMAAYWQAKAQLFAWPGLRAAVVNLDDEQGVRLAESLASGTVDTWTVSMRGPARLRAENIRHGHDGLAFDVREGESRCRVDSSVIGDYNVANLLAVIGVMRSLGVGLAEAASACAAVSSVPGRMQRVEAGTPGAGALPEVVVDYAHTPDALEKALGALRPLAAERGGRLWCVFGCGGNRDAAKRPMMGAIAVRLADRIVLTSDNPRLEAPDFIISQILVGAVDHPEVDVIESRDEAIRHAICSAAAPDVILLAGKGHESYQDIGGKRIDFSDAEHAVDALRRRGAKRVAAGTVSDGDTRRADASKAEQMFDLAEAAAGLTGARLVGDGRVAIARVQSDSRTLRAGDLFVALRGERFDGHDFLARASAAGAAAAFAEHGLAEAGLAGIEVDDARRGLGELAAWWRRRFVLPLVAITGSNGKTTVTQMIASIFRAWHGDGAFATQGNFNNDIGVPLTLLRLRDTHRAGVVELGMNHPGEIALLAAMAQPTVALVNNAQREHLEFMTSVDAVARENGATIDALGSEGVAVFPNDDPHAAIWRSLAGRRRTVTFALHGDADVTGQATRRDDSWFVEARTPRGPLEFTLHLPGQHNVANALAAVAAASASGAPLAAIVAGLETFRPVRGRSQQRRFERDGESRILVDDTYNANPDSVRAAIDVLATLPAPRWLVLGDMAEVGDEGPAFHREVGAHAAACGIESMWAVGPQAGHTAAAFPGARGFESVEASIAALIEAPPFASVLVKGSRFMAMERVVAALEGDVREGKDAH